jgi:hypothetical protein
LLDFDKNIMTIHESNAKTRLLLALWDMGGLEAAVNKGGLTERVKRGKEKSGEYAPYLEALAEQGAIALITKGRNTQILMTELGKQSLGAGLIGDDFAFGGNQVGSRVPNALLKWIRQMGDLAPAASSTPKISSYDEFKSVALETYDQLNRDYNLDNLVPIYRIRREIGDRVERSQFNDWLLEMQTNDILQLQGGGVEDDAPDKLEDSILTKVSGLRCFAKRIG